MIWITSFAVIAIPFSELTVITGFVTFVRSSELLVPLSLAALRSSVIFAKLDAVVSTVTVVAAVLTVPVFPARSVSCTFNACAPVESAEVSVMSCVVPLH